MASLLVQNDCSPTTPTRVERHLKNQAIFLMGFSDALQPLPVKTHRRHDTYLAANKHSEMLAQLTEVIGNVEFSATGTGSFTFENRTIEIQLPSTPRSGAIAIKTPVRSWESLHERQSIVSKTANLNYVQQQDLFFDSSRRSVMYSFAISTTDFTASDFHLIMENFVQTATMLQEDLVENLAPTIVVSDLGAAESPKKKVRSQQDYSKLFHLDTEDAFNSSIAHLEKFDPWRGTFSSKNEF